MLIVSPFPYSLPAVESNPLTAVRSVSTLPHNHCMDTLNAKKNNSTPTHKEEERIYQITTTKEIKLTDMNTHSKRYTPALGKSPFSVELQADLAV